jgi:drug/metabolite transporter (DMT)-like permease
MLILANLLWGLSFPIIKSITRLNALMLPGSGTWFQAAQALGPRFTLAALLMAPFVWRGLLRSSRPERMQALGIGLFAAVGTTFQTDGLQFTAASTSAFLTQFSAILIPLWLAVRHRRNPGRAVWTGCAMVLIGVAVLGRFDPRTFTMGRGESETLLSSVCFMGQILWVERPCYAGNRMGVVTVGAFCVVSACFAAMLAFTAPRMADIAVPWHSGPWVVLTLVLAVACTIAAFSLMNRWQPRITATEAGLIYCVEPLFASVFALVLPGMISAWVAIGYPNERLGWPLLIGGSLITGANILVLKRSAPVDPESNL